MPKAKPTDRTIVRAAIHPAIGIARIGDSESEYFIGPEVTTPQPQAADYYRDPRGRLKTPSRALSHLWLQCAGRCGS